MSHEEGCTCEMCNTEKEEGHTCGCGHGTCHSAREEAPVEEVSNEESAATPEAQ